MGAYIYASGSYHPLEGNQIVSGGQMLTLKENDEIIVNGSSVPVGNPASGADVVIGEMISGATSYTGKILKDCYVMSRGNLNLTSGGVINLQVTNGGTANLSAVTDITRSTQLTVNAFGLCTVNSGSIVTNASVSLDCLRYLDRIIVGSGNNINTYGSVDNIPLATRGSLTVIGGSVNSLIVDGGQVLLSGGQAHGVSVMAHQVNSFCYEYSIREYDLPAPDRHWSSSSTQRAHKGHFIVNAGTASNVNLISGDALVNGGRIESLVIGSGCSVFASGGVISGVIVSNGGTMHVSNGGAALEVTSRAGATIINYGGTITYA